MKRGILAALLLGMTVPSLAENPDRYPSLSLGFRVLDLDGDRNETDRNLPAGLDARTTAGQNNIDGLIYKANFRYPVHNSLTIDFNVDWYDYEHTSAMPRFGIDRNFSGPVYGFDLRHYFNQ